MLYRLSKTLFVMLALSLCILPTCIAEETRCMVLSSGLPGPKYKGIPASYCGGYLLKEFDIAAKSKANLESDWTANMVVPTMISDWPAKAKEKGWAVNDLVSEPLVGSIGIKTKTDGSAWFKWYFVRGVESDGILVSMMQVIPGNNKQRLVVTKKLEASFISSSQDGFEWVGWIYPLKGDAHAIYVLENDKK